MCSHHMFLLCVTVVCGGDAGVASPPFHLAVSICQYAQQQCAFAAVVFSALIEQLLHKVSWQSGADARCLLSLGLAFIGSTSFLLDDIHSPSNGSVHHDGGLSSYSVMSLCWITSLCSFALSYTSRSVSSHQSPSSDRCVRQIDKQSRSKR